MKYANELTSDQLADLSALSPYSPLRYIAKDATIARAVLWQHRDGGGEQKWQPCASAEQARYWDEDQGYIAAEARMDVNGAWHIVSLRPSIIKS